LVAQLAVKDDVAKEPLKLANAQPLTDRLNQADHSEDDVGADAVYAAAGLAKDGIVDRIRAQMAVSVRSTAWLLARKATTGGVGHRNEASARYG